MSGPADILDQAAELSQKMGDMALAAARAKARPEQVARDDGSWPHPDCVDCDEPIPAARLALGKIRCIACQTQRERWKGV